MYKNDSKSHSNLKSHSNIAEYFKELPFCNKHIEKPKIKRLKNIDLLAELPFYEELSVIKTDRAFRGYAMSYTVEIVERKDPIVQPKGFQYQIIVNVTLKNTNQVEKLNFVQFILIQ